MLQRRADAKLAQAAPDRKLQHGAGMVRPDWTILRVERELFLHRCDDAAIVKIENGASAGAEAVDLFAGNFSFEDIINGVPESILPTAGNSDNAAALHIELIWHKLCQPIDKAAHLLDGNWQFFIDVVIGTTLLQCIHHAHGGDLLSIVGNVRCFLIFPSLSSLFVLILRLRALLVKPHRQTKSAPSRTTER